MIYNEGYYLKNNNVRLVSMKKITSKLQLAFIDEYVVDKNGAAAATRAGYSKKTANAKAHELLKQPEIKAAIESKLKALSDKTGATAEFVINELMFIAKQRGNDVADWVNGSVVFKSSEELSDDVLATISSVKVKDTEWGSEMQVKRYDKIKALEMLGKHLNLFDKDDEGDKNGNVTIIFQRDPNPDTRTATNAAT